MEPNWYALYTRPKFEKKVADRLFEEGYDAWLPLQTVVRQWSDRKKKVEIPLFNGYVFVNTERCYLYEAVQIDGIARAVGFNGQPAVIREEQIEMIRKVLIGPDAFEITETEFVKGDPVEITDGALKGNAGIWVEWRGKKKVALYVENISKAILVEVPAPYIQKIKDTA